MWLASRGKFLMPDKVKLSLARFSFALPFATFFYSAAFHSPFLCFFFWQKMLSAKGQELWVAYLNLWLCRYAVCPHCLGGRRKSDSGPNLIQIYVQHIFALFFLFVRWCHLLSWPANQPVSGQHMLLFFWTITNTKIKAQELMRAWDGW